MRAVRLVRLLGPSMAEHGNSVIINISSVAGLYARPNAVGYASSKWGLTGCALVAACVRHMGGVWSCTCGVIKPESAMQSQGHNSCFNQSKSARAGVFVLPQQVCV